VRPRLRRATGGLSPAPFVVASPRSGTTLLRMMLDAHPQMAVPFETHFVPELIETVEDGGGPQGAFDVLHSHRRWGDFHLDADALMDRLRSHDPLTPGDAVRSFYGLYAESQGKPRWGDKTPEYVEFMRPISQAVPEARFVHVIRDGRDVALSRIKWRQERSGKTPPVRRMARRWKEAITVARKQARRLDHYIEVRYEDLVAEPEPTLRRICEFAELGDLPGGGGRPRSASERAVQFERVRRPLEKGRAGSWRDELSAQDRAEFESLAGPLLAELGYPTQ